MGNKKTQDIPFMVTELVSTPPEKVSGKRRIEDLDFLDIIADDAILIVQHGTRTFRTTKAALIGSLGKIYLTEGILLDPAVNGVIEFVDGHLFFTNNDLYAFVFSNAIKTDTSTAVNTVVETVVYSHTIPGDSLHADQRIFFNASGVFSADSASETVTIKYKINDATIHSVAITPTNGTDIAWRAVHEGTFRTAGASGTYVDFSEFSESGVAPLFAGETTTHPVDTTIDTLYEVTATWGAAKAGNSFSCTQGDLTYKH